MKSRHIMQAYALSTSQRRRRLTLLFPATFFFGTYVEGQFPQKLISVTWNCN